MSESAPRAECATDCDVAIVGAGAAGIGAARLLRGRGLRVLVLEARPVVGGRCVTALFGGHPIDLGAHWLHAGDLNPLVTLGRRRGEPLRRAPGAGHVVRGGRFGDAAERRLYGQAFERADRAFTQAARDPADRSIASAMPPLGRFGAPIAATMALVSGRPLEEVSLQDFPSDEFGDNYFVRGGYGAYLARLAIGLPIRTGCPVDRIAWSEAGVALSGSFGRVGARAALVTVPVPVLAAGGIRFEPGLPAALADAIGAIRPGTYEHVILNWPGSPFRGPDRLAKVATPAGGIGLMTNIDGAPFHYLELDHAAARALPDGPARARFARDLVRREFGAAATRGLRVLGATDWLRDPFSLSSWAVVPPGRAAIRRGLAEPVGPLRFAGEATSRQLWGTVGGAWQEGEAAAAALALRLGGDGGAAAVSPRRETA
jgi:monoamine oxidase